MLEVRGLTKVYNPKKGPPVRALDGVNLKFEETGMVFVLGKSGSGKSTFLNLIGGLDTITGGDVIIKGKSSADFTQGDFDSYRNTFIGFIFQEYNILNEFSVGKNIALALELQGKRADNAAVDAILQQVDLGGYAGRRPNELSGGQKQRIAIARALIKDPEIIMADEPTGALDSNTGKQVFETLQKLSKTKLVIIVSHDRDYAEFYGDRVIEFSDGRVISDIKKYKAKGQAVSEGVSILDNKILHVKKGHKFSDSEKQEIIGFLENPQGDIILSKDEKSNADFRRMARIDAEGNKESFENVTPDKQKIKEYDPKQFKLIHSKLPIRHSLKIAGSSLKAKPIRLFFTILLSIVAFGMFGLADTLGSYNKYDATYQSMQQSNINYAAFRKQDGVIYTDWRSGDETDMTETDAQKIKDKFSGYKFDALRNPSRDTNWSGGVYELSYGDNIYQYNKDSSTMGMYYTHSGSYYGGNTIMMGGIIEVDPTGISSKTYRGFSITGEFPAADDEVMISQHVYEAFEAHGYFDYKGWQDGGGGTGKIDNFKTVIQNKQQLIGKKIVLGGNYGSGKAVKIVGIIDTQFPTMYNDTKTPSQSTDFNYGEMMKANEIASLFYYGYHGALYVKNGAFENFKTQSEASKYFSFWSNGARLDINTTQQWSSFDYGASAADIGKNGLKAYFAQPGKTTLGENEVLLSLYSAANYFEEYNWIYEFANEWSSQKSEATIKAEIDLVKAELLKRYDEEAFIDYVLNYFLENTSHWDPDLQQDVRYANTDEVAAWMEDMSKDGYNEWDEENQEDVFVVTSPGSVEKYILSYWTWGCATLEEAYIYRCKNANYGDRVLGLSWEDAKILALAPTFADYLFDSSTSFSVKGKLSTRSDSFDLSLNIVGIAVDTEISSSYNNFNSSGIVVDETIYSNMTAFERGNIIAMITSISNANRDEKMAMIRFSFEEELRGKNNDNNDMFTRYMLKNSVTATLEQINDTVESLTKIFLYVGIGFAVFAAFLLLNFIMVSISYKKREIGILRAIGARSGDVFMIFFLESLIIALICFVFASIGCGIASVFINKSLLTELGFVIKLLNFGLRQIALILAVSVGVAFVATFLPVFRTSRKKPIETIRKV